MGQTSHPSPAELLPLLMLVLQLSLISAVLRVRRLGRWGKKLKRRTSAARARPEEQSASPTADGAVEKPTLPVGMWASAEALDSEHLSLRASLASMPSLGSLTDSNSISMDTLYSFPEPWPGAMAELAALRQVGPPQAPVAVERPVEEPGPALDQDPSLELPVATEQQRFPGDGGDKAQSLVDTEPRPNSPPAMATSKGELVQELIQHLQAAQVVNEQRLKMLQAVLDQYRGSVGGSRGACSGTILGKSSLPPSRIEVQVLMGLLKARVWPPCLGAGLPWADANGDMYMEEDRGPDRSDSLELGRSSKMGVKSSSPVELHRNIPSGLKRSSSVVSGQSSPVGLKRRSPMGLKRSSPMELGSSSSMGPGSSIPAAPDSSAPAEPSPQRRVPVGRARGRAAPEPCGAGGCLWEGCAQLWGCLKAWWRRLCQPPCVSFCSPLWWRHWSHKIKEFYYN